MFYEKLCSRHAGKMNLIISPFCNYDRYEGRVKSMAWPHLAEHPEVGGEGEIGHRGVQAAAPGRVALPHLKIYVSTS